MKIKTYIFNFFVFFLITFSTLISCTSNPNIIDKNFIIENQKKEKKQKPKVLTYKKPESSDSIKEIFNKTPPPESSNKSSEKSIYSIPSLDKQKNLSTIDFSNKTYQIYDKYDDLINLKLNFTNKNFKAINLENGKYQKHYRLHQLYKNSIWKFDKKSNNFLWSVDEQWITNMTKRDDGGSNINLYLYIESYTPNNKNDIIKQLKNFKNYEDDRSDNKDEINRYRDDKQYPLGIKFNWNKLKIENNIIIKTPKWFDVNVKYDANTKQILFTIKPKSNIIFTDDPAVLINKKNTNQYVLISSVNNFLSLSFETNNKENKTLKKFKILSKAEEGVNVNALDLSTRDNNKKDENRYLDLGNKIEYKDVKNSLIKELISRSFYNLTYIPSKTKKEEWQAAGGTWTMIRKVKPSDPNDERYYVMTNQHVSYSKENHYNQYQVKGFGIRKYADGREYNLYDKNNKIYPLSKFWGFETWKNRYSDEVIKNSSGTRNKGFIKQDVQVSILDLKKVFQIIDQNLENNKNNFEKKNLNTLKLDFKKWSTYAPLKFTDKYKLVNFNSQYLDKLFLVGYPYSTLTIGEYNSFDTHFSSYMAKMGYSNGYRGWKNNKWVDTAKDILGPGSSGSLVVNGDREIVGINNLGYGSHKWSPRGEGFFFYSPTYDIIGSNVDGSNPSENNNPSTFGHALIEFNKRESGKFEIFDDFKDLNNKKFN